METIQMAKRLAELGKPEEACKGYELALRLQKDLTPEDKMEAALFVLQFGGDYTYAYRAFLELNHSGNYVQETAAMMTEAFYAPNEKLLRSHYENNCKQLKKYKYMFRNDFLPFEELPIRFYPFDDKSYVPYYVREGRFGEITDYSDPVISRSFFHDLENPILARDVYSQYELEYLNDNVRPSEYVAKENHIYLHYTSWAEFCAHLQVLLLRKMLVDQKFVFLIENEIEMYPIDFKEKYGIDYSRFPLKPVGLREINRLVWHTQLSYHNGGDFFNEVLDGHPNLICTNSIMNDSMEGALEDIRETLNEVRSIQELIEVFDANDWGDPEIIKDLYRMRNRTDKDILVGLLCRDKKLMSCLDPASRIVPAIMYQPHFGHVSNNLVGDSQGRAMMTSDQFDAIKKSSVFKNFKYIKTFTPMRRITTSYGATVRFMALQPDYLADGRVGLINDEVLARVTFRGFMQDEQQRVFKDCVVVRFEDGKLNPTATFKALAEFLDLPYTESMTYCSFNGEQMDEIIPGNVQGFDTASVYKTYDEYANDAERTYIEYFLRDAYEYYGYDFHYYDGAPMTRERVKELIDGFDIINSYIRKTRLMGYTEGFERKRKEEKEAGQEKEYDITPEEEAEIQTNHELEYYNEKRLFVADLLMKGLNFVNEDGQPMKFMPKLRLDPALLQQPLYR